MVALARWVKGRGRGKYKTSGGIGITGAGAFLTAKIAKIAEKQPRGFLFVIFAISAVKFPFSS
jgi:hypothetical protein